jgi:xylose isomerase
MVEALLVIAEAGGFGKGGVNFDAKVRRNSTDPEDLLVAHITGIDLFARALLSADAILRESEYRGMRRQRYASFDGGEGKRFENGELTFEDLRKQVTTNGEPAQTSGKQELLEQIITMFM